MSGRVIRAIPRTVFDFSYLGANANEERYLAGGIDASQFTSVDLMVRIHNRNIDATDGGTIVCQIFADGTTAEDPRNYFLNPVGTEVTVNKDTEVGTMLTDYVGSGFGSMLVVRLLATQGTTAGNNLVADISVDLVLKGA